MSTELDFDKLRRVCEAAIAKWPEENERQMPMVQVNTLMKRRDQPNARYDFGPLGNFGDVFRPTLVKQLLDLAQREYERQKK